MTHLQRINCFFPGLFFILIFISGIFGFQSDVQANEVIEHFDSRVIIDSDSSLNVTETITVNAEGKEIKRGIFRDFPTKYKDIYGNNFNVKFNLIAVLRNGEPEDYHTENISNGIRIYIGNKDRFLDHGTHTFTLQYYTNRQLGFFEQYDELFWNVTGNQWAFPIINASAVIKLPPGVTTDQIETDAFTGASGDKGKQFVVSTIDEQTVLFESIAQLAINHGLSVVVNWPKGFVKEPTQDEKIAWFFQDNQAAVTGLSGLAILWAYLYFAWLKVGKDPHKGIIYPRYQPDQQHSPASMRFVQRMGYDKKAFAAALVNMAVKGYLTITEDSNFSIKKTGQTAKLSLGEAAIAKNLFNNDNKIVLKRSEHAIIGKAVKAHNKVLKRDYEKIFFQTNKLALLPGWLISIALLVITVLAIESADVQAIVGFFSIWLSFWSIGVAFLLFAVYNAWKNVKGFLTFLPALFITAFSIPFLAGEGVGLYMMWQNAGTGVLLIFLLTIISNILFYQWMKAPTLKGRELLDKIEGFKHYLMVAEGEEIKQAPELTPQLFEKYLPYAMALDVENQWSDRFSSVFSQLADTQHHHSPHWYRGRHWNTNNLAGFSSSMGGSLSSAIASSSTAPGSSSGSGGGGSSGGGGGGGGGGGW